MSPNREGRFCNSCQKSVVDFSVMADEEIQLYFIKHQNQPVCGRFKTTQIHRIVIDLPQNIFSTKMPTWMRFLVACLIIFGISIFPFETTVAGKLPTETSFYQGEPIAVKAEKKLRILKKKKKRRQRIHISRISSPDGIIYMAGYTVYDPFPSNDVSIFDTTAKQHEELTISLSGHPVPEKEQPGPTPYMPTEFILPSILAFRRKSEGNSMD